MADKVLVAACYWCGELQEPAPKTGYEKGILDYKPCPSCRKVMDEAEIVVLEVEAAREGGAPEFFETGAAPTGRWSTITAEEVRKVFPEQAETIIKAGRCLIEAAIFKAKFTDAST